jgi:hypothetical protein
MLWISAREEVMRMPTDFKLQFKSALDYGVDPGGWTGNWDTSTPMGSNIQAALNDAVGCPNGSTLYFPPGTYKCDLSLFCTRPISIWAYGATFDFGTMNFTPIDAILTAFTYGGGVSPRVAGTFVGGLSVVRTLTGGSNSTNCKGRGFRWYAIHEVTVDSCYARGFEIGQWVTGAYTGGYGGGGAEYGNVYNQYRNLRTASCKYAIYLEPGDAKENQNPPPVSPAAWSGWCNENNFWGGRALLALDDPENCEAIHIQWTKIGNPPVSEPHGPNNNRFYGLSLEGQWGRKIFCEGRDNVWIQCRYELERGLGQTDIEFKDTAGGGYNNVLLYGDRLANSLVTSTGSGATKNQKVTPSAVDLSVATLSSAEFKARNPAGGSTPILRVQNSTGTEDRIVARESVAGVADAIAGWTFHGQGSVQRNALYLKSTYQLATAKELIVNDAGEDADSRIAGKNEPNLLCVDASADRLGIGTATPALRCQITGPHVEGSGTLGIINTAEHAYITLDHGTSVDPGKKPTFGMPDIAAGKANGVVKSAATG